MTSTWSQCPRAAVHAVVPSTATILTTMLMATTVAACSSASPAVSEPTVRVIARFKPGVPDPLDPAFLARLADLNGVTRIDPIRPMSGNAYVLQVACVDPKASRPVDDPCAAALTRLGHSDAILGIEVDRREKLQ